MAMGTDPSVFFIFLTAHFFNSILCQPANGTLAFAEGLACEVEAKAKEPFFSQRTKTTIKTLNRVIFFNLTD